MHPYFDKHNERKTTNGFLIFVKCPILEIELIVCALFCFYVAFFLRIQNRFYYILNHANVSLFMMGSH